MKEIKFRAWDKKKKKMIYPLKDEWLPRTEESSIQKLQSSKRYILIQFTGLKDKNGKEIYRGDFLAYAGKDVEVIFEDSTASFKVKRGIYVSQISKMIKAQIEIIGNKFENPELLK